MRNPFIRETGRSLIKGCTLAIVGLLCGFNIHCGGAEAILVADSDIRGLAHVRRNFGERDVLITSNSPELGKVGAVYLKFMVPVEAGAGVSNAVLKLTAAENKKYGFRRFALIGLGSRASNKWSETAINWMNAPGLHHLDPDLALSVGSFDPDISEVLAERVDTREAEKLEIQSPNLDGFLKANAGRSITLIVVCASQSAGNPMFASKENDAVPAPKLIFDLKDAASEPASLGVQQPSLDDLDVVNPIQFADAREKAPDYAKANRPVLIAQWKPEQGNSSLTYLKFSLKERPSKIGNPALELTPTAPVNPSQKYEVKVLVAGIQEEAWVGNGLAWSNAPGRINTFDASKALDPAKTASLGFLQAKDDKLVLSSAVLSQAISAHQTSSITFVIVSRGPLPLSIHSGSSSVSESLRPKLVFYP